MTSKKEFFMNANLGRDVFDDNSKKIFEEVARGYIDTEIDIDLAEKALEEKLYYNRELFNGKHSLKIENSLSDSDYSIEMYKEFFKKISNIKEHTISFIPEKRYRELIKSGRLQKLVESVTISEIVNNKIEKDFYLLEDERPYPEGTKLTKILIKILDLIRYSEREKFVGNFKRQKDTKADIFLSLTPTAIMVAAENGNSCFSSGGSNRHSGFCVIGYPNTFVAYSDDSKYRAWISTDNYNKKASVFGGYPRENYYYRLKIIKFLESLGYEIVKPHYFSYPQYMSYDTTIFDIKKNIEYSNKDAFYSWNKSLFVEIGKKQRNNSIIDVFENYSEEIFFTEEEALQSEETYSEYEDDYYDDDIVYYSDLIGMTINFYTLEEKIENNLISLEKILFSSPLEKIKNKLSTLFIVRLLIDLVLSDADYSYLEQRIARRVNDTTLDGVEDDFFIELKMFLKYILFKNDTHLLTPEELEAIERIKLKFDIL